MRNKYVYWLGIFLTIFQFSYSQNPNSNWVFGDSSGINFSNINNPTPFNTGMDWRGSCSSVSDSSGNLIFYAVNQSNDDSSAYIYNSNHQIMQNGDRLAGAGLYTDILIINKSGSSNLYFVFHRGAFTTKGFYYSLVDLSLNGGLGSVIQRNIVLDTNRQADCVQAIKHANGRDWWIINKLSSSNFTMLNRFMVYLVTPSGVLGPVIQDFGNATDIDLQKIVVNNKADKLMVINFRGFMCEYEFDRCTGIISNPNIIFPEQNTNFNRNFWEGAYSPNDSLFYASASWYSISISDTSRLLQFNLFATDIPASCDTLSFSKNPLLYGAVRLAPDDKIYMTTNYNYGGFAYPYPDSVRNIYNENLGVINFPDSLGNACNYLPFSFYLGGKRTYAGLPNNPYYQLGPVTGSICDSLTVGISQAQPLTSELKVFYHPQWKTAFINAQNLKGKHAVLSVYDIAGHLIFRSSNDIINGYYTH
jgi:hypothetical protein